ncbi:MAG: type IV pilus twitching motility protein PilT [Lentisphaerae bacterium]|jgi:twitching motility protein PilT|nr:type IV pilus twitching motility protein PilT [Lentisphaerota bacterium]MBT4819785.1 type IV pilus twitching motility protein PilT [Lentisphaerota bacterium]MBT5607739.1 type IV pilus twitching motility protein PilT [Lentisphaerota bacterium]MBT7054902.1 type IV pilus twitching motility protein PilT [Lentisphaerota bacterium]MBT7843328.1 type IV pilus twitching motility protein PilT [Lentisphaerota bacterium]
MAIEMAELLQLVIDEGASDLHLPVGSPPVLRIHGGLTALDTDPLTPEDTERLMKSITSEVNQQRLQEEGGVDFGFAFGDQARFRVSAFRQKGSVGMVLRSISNALLTLEQIGLPAAVKDILFRPRGMVLVTGPTGSGKSTTLASMIDIVNQERDCHVITVEDPIEFYHNHKTSVLTQREIGIDVPSFGEALRRALRQDPDVILVGEMRDLETIGAAITAAETGHLVFGTLHTTGAAETVDRIVDAFPTDQQEQVRTQLASSLICVISQVLLPRIDTGGRIAAFEIMLTTPSIAALIRDNKTYRITSDIQTGAKYGMNTLDSHLMDLYSSGKINYGELITKCRDPEGIVQKIQQDSQR